MHDRLGSVRLIINDAGAVQNYYTYDPFGTLFDNESSTTTVTNPYRFAGYFWDDEIAQYYCRARQYDPSIQRFTSIDPVIGKFIKPLTLHQYLYCLNDPVNFIDPDGNTLLGLLGRGAVTAYIVYDVIDSTQSILGYIENIIRGVEVWGALRGLGFEALCAVGPGKAFKIFDKARDVGKSLKALKKAGRIAKQTKRQADKALKNKKFSEWFHQVYKEQQKMPGGGIHNPNLPDEEVLEALEEWISLGKPGTS